MSHKYITKVVWYILVQLGFFNNTMSMVSGVSVQVSAFWPLASRCWPQIGFKCQCSGVRFKGSGFWSLVVVAGHWFLEAAEGCPSVFICYLSSVICFLTPDTRNLIANRFSQRPEAKGQ